MDNLSSNDDEEPKVCTVFASSASSGSKTVFDTIAFANPKKDLPQQPLPVPSSSMIIDEVPGDERNTMASTSTSDIFSTRLPERSMPIMSSDEGAWNDKGLMHSVTVPSGTTEAKTPELGLKGDEIVDIFAEAAAEVQDKGVTERLNNLVIQEASPQVEVGQGDEGQVNEVTPQIEPQSCKEEDTELESPIPTANRLFAGTPEVPFPIGQFTQSENSDPSTFYNQLSISPPVSVPSNQPQAFIPGPFSTGAVQTQDITLKSDTPVQPQQALYSMFSKQPLPTQSVAPSVYNAATFTSIDSMYDAWIPKEETKKVLLSITAAVRAGSYFPDKSNMTTPGIIYEDDLIDKVGVNISRIFGEAEASKRRILTADSVTQNDEGLRELIKLGCYRSAINLTKRLLTLYGQGPGKVGQFCKHNPHTLQLWFTRISLLIRIREFTIAESEIDAFKDFDNPDLYYEYYPDCYGKGRKGCMVPFNFRVLAAEILQYSKKHNETIDKLTRILSTVQQMIHNLEGGLSEDGSIGYEEDNKEQSLDLWLKREIRVYYSLANASLFAKDYYNSLKYLIILTEKDHTKVPQLSSAIGRFFLQLGDLTTANTHFQAAADIRQGDSDSEQAENLIDSAMVTIAHGSYPEAFALLQQALLIQPDNFMITNNMAVCLLYMGKVKESLMLMETTVKNNTPELLQENVLLNLSTIYELENTDGHKKNALLKLVGEYKGDGINLASLKMPNLI